jgi:cell division protein FtsB
MGTRPSAPMGTSPSAPMGTRPTSSSPVSRPLPGSTATPTRSPYSTATPKAPSKWARYFLRGLWIFSIFLLLRLVFTERGVMEYYGRKGTLKDKYESLSKIKKVNIELQKEIKKISKDSSYQKALVRNHLGFIARDEFIVLLPD